MLVKLIGPEIFKILRKTLFETLFIVVENVTSTNNFFFLNYSRTGYGKECSRDILISTRWVLKRGVRPQVQRIM